MVGNLIAEYLVEEAFISAGFQTATAFAVNFAVSQVLVRTFAQEPSSGQQQDNGIRQQIPPSSTNSIPIVYGDAYLGGTFVDAVLSDDQTTMYYVLGVSCVSPNGQFTFDTTSMYYGDRLITFKSSGNTNAVASLTDEAGNVDTAIATNDLLQIYLYKSSASGTITGLNTSSPPSTVMGGTDIASTYRWPSSGRQMNGLAFAIVKLKYSRDAQTTQLEPITFKCSQYLNSTGVAKPGDVWYDYITNTVYGGAIGSSYVDSASATALNTYADQTITYTPSGGGSATQARYRINGVLNAGETVLNNLDRILTACDSWMAYQTATGQWSIVINKAESSSYSFDDTNIIGEIRLSATDITNSINQIEAKFPFKENRDQPEYVNLQTPSGLLYPNEPVNKYTTTFDLVNDSVQATYLANRILEQAREDLIVSFSTTYYGIQVDAGNVISVTNSNYGWSNKLFRVMKVNESSLPDGTLGARLELNEYNADVYDDASITQFTPVPNSGLAAPSYFPALSAPTVIASRPTGDVPSFDVRVGIPSVGRVTYVQLFYTTNSSPSASDWILFDTYSQSNSQPLVNGTNFDFLNEILPGGTFYFAYVVGNEIAASVLSTKSSSFAWAPTGPAIQTASVSLYQWSATTPANPTGNSTYTWSTATDSGYTASDGWTIAIPANPGTSGLSLWEAQKNITASPGTTTTTVNWTTGVSVYAIAQNGTSGNSSRICFARVASNPSPVSGSIVTSGGSSYPSSAQSLSTWGFSATWGASDPDPTSTNSLYQADGVYDPVANQTTWTTPYISSLKVGYLSAISADLGSINSGSMAIGGITPSTIPIGNIWNFNGLATTANMLDVVYVTTSSTWVAVGSGGASWYRAAGSTTWNYVYTGNSADFYSVATNGTSLVAIGGNSTIIGTISAGVLSWSASTGSQRTSTTLQYRVIYVSSVNRYFTFSLLNLWYSNSSGNSWQSTTNPGNAVGCAFDGSLLWACSYSSGNVYNTTLTDNGTTVTVSWSASISTGGSNGATRDFVYLGGRFVLVGTAVRTSTSGASGTWSGTTSYPGINRVGYFSDLSNSKFYGVGISSGYSVIWQSSNGFQSSTQLITGPTQTLNAVAFSSIEGVIVGNTGTYAISQIEDSWTGSGTSINNDGAFFTGSVGGSISFDGTALTLDVPYLQNRQTITTSATVKQNYNAFSVGTITISDTADVTVPSGSVWVIV